MDIRENEATKAIVQNRQGKWLSEQEERDLRNKHIQKMQDVIDRKYLLYPSLFGMSPEMRA